MSGKVAQSIFEVSRSKSLHLIEWEFVHLSLLEHGLHKFAAVAFQSFRILGEILEEGPCRIVIASQRECETEVLHVGLEKVCTVTCLIGGIIAVEILLAEPVSESLPPCVGIFIAVPAQLMCGHDMAELMGEHP